MIKDKTILSKRLNEELEEVLPRFETIFDYYLNNRDRLNSFSTNEKGKYELGKGNIYYVKESIQEFYKLQSKIINKYGVDVFDSDLVYPQDSTIQVRVLRNNKEFNLDSSKLEKVSKIFKKASLLKETMEIKEI